MIAADVAERASSLVPQVGFADADDVARGEPARTVELVPFRKVPFVEPRSCTQTPSWRGSKRAWRADANSSVAIGMSFWFAAADRELRASSSSKSSPLGEVGALHDDEPPGVQRPRLREACRPAPADGASTKLSCGSRRSRLAVRTIRQMNR